MRQGYLPETISLIKTFKEKCLATKPTRFEFFAKITLLENGKSPQQVTTNILSSMKGQNIAAIDGGLGSKLMGSVVPFMMRAVTYSVRIGDRTSSRESFTPSYFYVNRLTTGALGMDGDLLGAILLLFELSSALKSLRLGNHELFLLHGPLVRSLGQYSSYNLSLADIKSILDDEKMFDEFQLFLKKKNGEIILKEGAKSLQDDFRFFACASFLLGGIFEIAKEKSTTICGVVERTNSSEILQRVMFDDFDEVYPNNQKWMEKAVGYPFEKSQDLDKIRYVKSFLDNLGYTDQLILGSILQPGEYLSPIESRVNRAQKDNRNLGLDTGFISGLSEMENLIPKSKFSYIRTSEFNSPFKIEFPYDLAKDKLDYLFRAVYAFSQFLPQYSFPVNLDVVDKVAKIQNWMSNAVYSIILNEIYEPYTKEGPPGDLGLLLSGKSRDWDLRPGVRKSIV
jgi:hypothetical protein